MKSKREVGSSYISILAFEAQEKDGMPERIKKLVPFELGSYNFWIEDGGCVRELAEYAAESAFGLTSPVLDFTGQHAVVCEVLKEKVVGELVIIDATEPGWQKTVTQVVTARRCKDARVVSISRGICTAA